MYHVLPFAIAKLRPFFTSQSSSNLVKDLYTLPSKRSTHTYSRGTNRSHPLVPGCVRDTTYSDDLDVLQVLMLEYKPFYGVDVSQRQRV